MPHKHKRLKSADPAQFDLPPTAVVKGLPVKHANTKTKDTKHKVSKRKEKTYHDDTPKAFARLMQLRKTGKGYKGLDDGRTQPKVGGKRKRDADAGTSLDDRSNPVVEAKPDLQIQPGERLTDYAARVDQALPVSGLIAKQNKVEGMREQRQTKHEKKLQRLVNNWKTEEAKRIEKAQEEWDDAEDEADENEAVWETHQPANRKKGKRKADEDPWEELKKKRDKPKGVFDVVQAPPQFTKVPKDFKVKDGAKVNVDNVPNSGSLRRQELLSETRQDVINRYRQMMQAKRGES